jgi:20S proteasome alpha/beta subunit
MTVIVGVLCEDGIVIGSDSSATMLAGNAPSIEQPVKKTFIISDNVIMAGTGQGGFGQRFEDVLTKLRAANKFEQEPDKFKIVKEISKLAQQDFGYTGGRGGQFGALIAFQSSKGFHLCEFAISDFQPEFKTDEQWFCCMGSGQPLTDPLLGMLRRVFFRDDKPNLSEGLFAVTWALEHAIELNPGGINRPIQMAVLQAVAPSKRMTAKLLTPDELLEHASHVQGMEEHIGAYREIHAGRGVAPSPPPPSPPVYTPMAAAAPAASAVAKPAPGTR